MPIRPLLYIHIYLYIYVPIYEYIHMYICIHIYIYVHIFDGTLRLRLQPGQQRSLDLERGPTGGLHYFCFGHDSFLQGTKTNIVRTVGFCKHVYACYLCTFVYRCRYRYRSRYSCRHRYEEIEVVCVATWVSTPQFGTWTLRVLVLYSMWGFRKSAVQSGR